MKKYNIRLPRKMSALLRVAVADLTATENLPGYLIDMGAWHTPHPRSIFADPREVAGKDAVVCSVCLAGSMLAQRGFSKRREFDASRVSQSLKQKMYAVNALRKGEVAEAAEELGMLRLDKFGDPVLGKKLDKFNRLITFIPSYGENPKLFKRTLRKLANRLERNGL